MTFCFSDYGGHFGSIIWLNSDTTPRLMDPAEGLLDPNPNRMQWMVRWGAIGWRTMRMVYETVEGQPATSQDN